MATISIELGKPNKKGARSVYFLVMHEDSKKRLPAGVSIPERECRGNKIRNINYERLLELKRRELEDRMFEILLDSFDKYVDADYIVDRLVSSPSKDVEFFEFTERWLSRPENQHKINYRCMLNSLEHYLGKRKLPFDLITFSMLSGYEHYLANQQRGQSLYLGAMRHLYREAMREINTDYETIIKNDPFLRYRVPKQKPRTRVRALTLEQLLRIYNFKGRSRSRAQLARDCFIMSFCLMGMNSIDMFYVDDLTDGVIRYKRRKTCTRRADEAYIEVNVHPILNDLMFRYAGDKRVWNFCDRYTTRQEFNVSINLGLKDVGKAVGIKDLQFYSARHTFATLSRNLMKFSKSDVDEALNHVGSYDIADIYIEKDFSIINDNNKKLIERVFNWSDS